MPNKPITSPTFKNLWNWKTTTIAFALALFGTIAIFIGSNVTENDILQTALLTGGSGILVSGVAAIAYEFVLLSSVRKMIRSELDESIRDNNRNFERLHKAGVITAYPKFNSNIFSEEIARGGHANSTVRIMQSWVYSLDVFCDVIRQSLDQNLKTRILIGHPQCKWIIDRFTTTHLAADDGRAQRDLISRLEDFAGHISQICQEKPDDFEKLVKISLYYSQPAMTIYGIGNELAVGWFPLHKFAVAAPHIRCRRRLPSIEEQRSMRGFSDATIADMAIIHFDTVWKSKAVKWTLEDIRRGKIPPIPAPP